MNDLVIVETINNNQYVSSLRDLYLDCDMNKSQWSRWARGNVNHSVFFLTNRDWIRHDIMSNHNPVIDFKVTLEMAKHLVMQMKTDKAHEYRSYLIELEKAWNTPEVVMARALQISNNNILEYKNKISFLRSKIIEQTPAVEFVEMVTKSDKWLTLKQVSDILNVPEVGRNNLTKILRLEGFLTQYNQPYQKYKKQGLFKSVESVSKTGHISVSTVVSQKGLIKIRMVLLNPKSRNTAPYRLWKKEVFKKDLYTCQRCGYSGKDIEPHHIIPWAKSVNKRFDIDNGETLCARCHKIAHKKNGGV
jgi:anti-repressor protein